MLDCSDREIPRELVVETFVKLQGHVLGRGTCALCCYQEMNASEPHFERHEDGCPVAAIMELDL